MTIDTSQSTARDLSVAILAGGASRRMGADKALLMLASQTLMERIVWSVSGIASETMIIGDRSAYHHFGVPVVADTFPGAGPLGGIATALEMARCETVLVVACDMPLLSQPLLRAMADLPRDYDVLVPVTDSFRRTEDDPMRFQTLHAMYRRGCLPVIERRLAHGELQVAAALTELQVRELPEAWLRRYDADLVSFTNVNRPGDWEAAIAMLESDSVAVENRT